MLLLPQKGNNIEIGHVFGYGHYGDNSHSPNTDWPDKLKKQNIDCMCFQDDVIRNVRRVYTSSTIYMQSVT